MLLISPMLNLEHELADRGAKVTRCWEAGDGKCSGKIVVHLFLLHRVGLCSFVWCKACFSPSKILNRLDNGVVSEEGRVFFPSKVLPSLCVQ